MKKLEVLWDIDIFIINDQTRISYSTLRRDYKHGAVVYVDVKAKELEALIDGRKTMIVRGATGRKVPYGKVNIGDTLHFIRNNAEGLIHANATVCDILNSDKLTPEESRSLLEKYQAKLQLTDKQINRWGGKRYIVLITVKDINEIETIKFDRNKYSNSMDDWLVVESISDVIMK